MNRQSLIDPEWFDFCEDCGSIVPEGPIDGHSVCSACCATRDRAQAKLIGLDVSDDMSGDTVFGLLGDHRLVCVYLSRVWNDCLFQRDRMPIIQVGDPRCPWTAYDAGFVPRHEIDKLGVEILADDELHDEVQEAIFDLWDGHFKGSKTEIDPRYDTGQHCATESYWPAVPHGPTYDKIAALVWEKWHKYLPLKIAAAPFP